MRNLSRVTQLICGLSLRPSVVTLSRTRKFSEPQAPPANFVVLLFALNGAAHAPAVGRQKA